jgi:5-methylcytosine-specific restriction endonuclease McrA
LYGRSWCVDCRFHLVGEMANYRSHIPDVCPKHGVPFERMTSRTGGTFFAHVKAYGGLCYPPKEPLTRFECSECGEYRRQRTVPADGICQYCRATKHKPQNLPVKLSDELVVTSAVQRRLIKRAETETPKVRILRVSDAIPKYIFIPFVISSIPLAYLWLGAFLESSRGELAFLFFAFIPVWCIVPPVLVILILQLITRKPRARRRLLIDEKVRRLAEQRRLEIEERQIFYASAEWSMLRKRAISEQGRMCAMCKKYIEDEVDITVDHIRPRSKSPHLALSEYNLQVLCRRCNSRKGARDWY